MAENELVEFRKRLRRCREKVAVHMDWTNEKVDLWFGTKNPACGNISPVEFLLRRGAKAEKWIDALIYENRPHDEPWSKFLGRLRYGRESKP